ncbi:ubiquitin-conjugating enzyme E2 D3-like [Frankliniella occidentalis]|uniref:Ubiquitin-conjugating enzyme E2 D3-like n=1 Tax=Frankliniella occidentalis TaxID=133901 RepID=A0A9C6X521_FRAOC|nr:ubiquitin-conjugating enzyme E2 D3-like [Frankliniella occidentalis]
MVRADDRLKAEMKEMARSPLPYAHACPRADNIRKWDGVIEGPVDSPYEGGKFNFTMYFYYDYPFSPPKVIFKTRIYHCNFNKLGNVCLDTLKLPEDGGSWTSGMTISSVLISLHQLIGEANEADPLTLSIAKVLRKSRDEKTDEHDAIARLWTKRFAMPEPHS